MAPEKPLTAWTLANARPLELEVTRVTWPDEWLPGYFDYRVSISAGGVRRVGQGMDRDEALAFEKAAAEAFERAVVGGRPEPWATAAHTDPAAAARNAYLELLGIDRALCHHYCAVAPRPIALESFLARAESATLSRMLRKHGLSLRVGEMRPALDARVCAVFCWKDDPGDAVPGFVAGFGSASAPEEAALHALLECLRSSTSVFMGDPRPEKPLAELASAGSPRWHYWMAKTRESRERLMALLGEPPAPASASAPEPISISDAVIRDVPGAAELFPGLPLAVSQARSEKLLHPRFGPDAAAGLSRKRLEDFNGAPLAALTTVPHFYG